MAWTEQCKVAFKVSALGKLGHYKNKGRKVNGVLKEISRESDIPFETLKRWYYERENSISVKNDTDSDSISSENATDKSKTSDKVIEIPTCYRCKKNTVYLDRGKPLSENSKYFGLCSTCRRNQQYIEVIDREATNLNMGVMTVCPSCNHAHYVSIDRIEHVISEYNKVIKDEH